MAESSTSTAVSIGQSSLCLITQDSCPMQALTRVRVLDSSDESQVCEMWISSAPTAKIRRRLKIFFFINRS